MTWQGCQHIQTDFGGHTNFQLFESTPWFLSYHCLWYRKECQYLNSWILVLQPSYWVGGGVERYECISEVNQGWKVKYDCDCGPSSTPPFSRRNCRPGFPEGERMSSLLLSALHLLLLPNRSVHWCRIINKYQSEWIELLGKKCKTVQHTAVQCALCRRVSGE